MKKLISNVVGDSNVENNFQHKLLLTNRQILKLHKAFLNNSSANIKLSKTQLHKIGQSGRFLGRLSRPLLKTWLPLIGNVLKLLASVLMQLGLTSAAATDAVMKKSLDLPSFGPRKANIINYFEWRNEWYYENN